MARRRGDDIETAERQARAIELRRQRKTFAQIGAELGVSAPRAHAIYSAALAAIPAQQIDEHRAEALQELDYLASKALEVLHRHHVTVSNGRVVMLLDAEGDAVPVEDDGPVLQAIDRLLKIQERRAKLLGLDSPARHEVVTLDHLDAQIAALTAELAAGIPADEDAGVAGTSG